jgi:hypothetical protein
MDLVYRYVQAVKRHLPAALQEDIASELTEDILSELKDKEAALGRPLEEAEQESVLKKYGHPFLLATRYRPQQHLIGPDVFPFYWPALKFAIASAFGVYLIVSFATSVSDGTPGRFLGRLMAFPNVALLVFAWITLAFAAIDYSQAKLHIFDKWSPRSLPRVTPESPRVSRATLIGELAGAAVFLAWWLAVPKYPFLALGPAASFVTLSPAFQRIHLTVTLPAVVSIVIVTAILISPRSSLLVRLRRVLVNLATIGTASLLLKAGDLLIAADRGPNLVDIVKGINGGITLALLLVSIGTAIQTVLEIVRLMQTNRA